MTITAQEKSDLEDYVLLRACSEFRSGQPCVQRKADSKMIGNMHEGCVTADQMRSIIRRA